MKVRSVMFLFTASTQLGGIPAIVGPFALGSTSARKTKKQVLPNVQGDMETSNPSGAVAPLWLCMFVVALDNLSCSCCPLAVRATVLNFTFNMLI